jgi:hypothetical protein
VSFTHRWGQSWRQKIKKREGAFLDYMRDKVEDSLLWRPTTPLEVEELCGSLDPHKSRGRRVEAKSELLLLFL